MKCNGNQENMKNGCFMNKSNYKIFVAGLLFIIISLNLASQQSYIKNRWDLKVGYARPKMRIYDPPVYGMRFYRHANTNIEGNYGITEFLTIGAYVGYSKLWVIDSIDINNIIPRTYHTPFMGLKTNIHIFPLFIKHNDFRFDLYLTGKAGGYYRQEFIFEYNTGLGFAFYPWKHIGIYTEYTYGNLWVNNYYLRYGLVLKFNQ
jgi:hypothetical protein